MVDIRTVVLKFGTNPILDKGKEEETINRDRYTSEELCAEPGTHTGYQEEVQD